ncbi:MULTISPECIES: nitrate reductase cytochrome c-type subunit [Arcobacter]|jgi:cytochrome c-type protein NapB|uniref:Periplasmic nitrate reductase, electron transfer subunit n=1 Tax=Arcobacter ellisii TaxID=913109 RepID=A0A347U5Q3_9BACT|nr:nitrate reductase cytochrome c-type subunit [Arcobacter ellisii]AXX94181.1 periplasmic nitrate reductase NapAB, small subunit, periplasmic diheme cytochrome c550 protein [Arcobacter ellisii]RXI32537.1 nitrate reductase [Arcobacter ellisii]
MKLGKLTLAVSLAASILIAANTKNVIDDESIGLRKVDLLSEEKAAPDETKYGTSQPMSGYKIDRAYQNAPPMIPHDVEGMLNITRDNNACIGCHDAAVAESMGATPIPKSHYIDFRPKHKLEGEKFVKSIDNMKNEVSIKPIDTISNARFNCNACHAPQSTGDLAVENTFKPDFTREDGQHKSTWHEVLTDDLDTLKKK